MPGYGERDSLLGQIKDIIRRLHNLETNSGSGGVVPVVLIESGAPVPSSTAVGAIIYEKTASGGTGTGQAKGWWDGTAIQPIG